MQGESWDLPGGNSFDGESDCFSKGMIVFQVKEGFVELNIRRLNLNLSRFCFEVWDHPGSRIDLGHGHRDRWLAIYHSMFAK